MSRIFCLKVVAGNHQNTMITICPKYEWLYTYNMTGMTTVSRNIFQKKKYNDDASSLE